jgi:CheY-like chemotaxis protein
MVKDALELEGWVVETCADGAEARRILASEQPYDLLIVDYDLPGHNGIELLRYVRTLPHRQRVPAIMLSASDAEAQARHAGAVAFLRKPDDVGRLTDVVARLLSNRE